MVGLQSSGDGSGGIRRRVWWLRAVAVIFCCVLLGAAWPARGVGPWGVWEDTEGGSGRSGGGNSAVARGLTREEVRGGVKRRRQALRRWARRRQARQPGRRYSVPEPAAGLPVPHLPEAAGGELERARGAAFPEAR